MRGRPDCDALACRSIHSRQAEVRGRRPNASATTHGRGTSCAPMQWRGDRQARRPGASVVPARRSSAAASIASMSASERPK